MHVTTYSDAAAFLQGTQRALEADEVANSLMLGICLRLIRHPEYIDTPPCFRTVADEQGLVLAGVMTPPFGMVLYGARGDLSAAARALAADLRAEGWHVPGVEGPAEVAAPVAACLAEARPGQPRGRRPRLDRRQHLYELRAVRTPVPAHGRLRLATEADAPLVAGWWYGSSLAAFGQADAAESDRLARRYIAGGDVYLWDVGRPVSQAVTTSPTYRGIKIGRVYTPLEERGRGYATACVGELSRLMLAQGQEFCTLFVEETNSVAQRVYQRVGYRPVATFDEILLEE